VAPAGQTNDKEVPVLLEKAMKRLEEARALDEPAEKLAGLVGPAFRPRLVKNALSGTWLGHKLHPAMVPLPIGMWTGALVLDGIATERARFGADVLVGAGVAAALPTAAAGLSDWSDTYGEARRVGFAHATANSVALTCYTASLVARLLGRRKAGFALSLVGAGAMGLGGFLGGHLSYVLGVGVERKAFAPDLAEWTPVLADAELAEGEPRVVEAGGARLLLYRQAGAVYALADRCNHEDGPLHEGKFENGCVICPWHGSTYRLADGGVVRGPAAASQPTYDTRVADGTIQLRSPR
jgi:nitrite reductase/ring-hydroxylating ferredoxin subunit/uncharacterized membrane protein